MLKLSSEEASVASLLPPHLSRKDCFDSSCKPDTYRSYPSGVRCMPSSLKTCGRPRQMLDCRITVPAHHCVILGNTWFTLTSASVYCFWIVDPHQAHLGSKSTQSTWESSRIWDIWLRFPSNLVDKLRIAQMRQIILTQVKERQLRLPPTPGTCLQALSWSHTIPHRPSHSIGEAQLDTNATLQCVQKTRLWSTIQIVLQKAPGVKSRTKQ